MTNKNHNLYCNVVDYDVVYSASKYQCFNVYSIMYINTIMKHRNKQEHRLIFIVSYIDFR